MEGTFGGTEQVQHLFYFNRETGQKVDLSDAYMCPNNRGGRFSPDGKTIATVCDYSDPEGSFAAYNTISLVEDFGDRVKEIATEPDMDQVSEFPAWSPDGEQLVFWSHGSRGSFITTIGRDGQNRTEILDLSSLPGVNGVAALDWSPSGKILLVTQASGPGKILMMEPDGSGLNEMPEYNSMIEGIITARFSRDGSMVAFIAGGLSGGHYCLWTAIWMDQAHSATSIPSPLKRIWPGPLTENTWASAFMRPSRTGRYFTSKDRPGTEPS